MALQQQNTDGSRVKLSNIFFGDEPLGGGFAPFGFTISTAGMKTLNVWTDVEWKSSTEIEMCVHAKKTEDATESYQIPLQYAAADGKMECIPLCYRIDDTAYNRIVIAIPIGDLYPFVQLYYRASGGVPAARLINIDVTMRA